MKSLSETWFADGYIDFELKKYTLLAYLQEIKSFFDERKLYPALSDLIFHYNNLVSFRENKKFLQEQFPKKLTGIQIEKLQLLYEQMMDDDELMQELESIIAYSGNRMKHTILTGTEIYEEVEDRLNISPVGLIPLDVNDGYFFLSSGSNDVKVYNYHLSIYEKHDEKYRGIKTSFIQTSTLSIAHTYESIKAELIRTFSSLPNPAVYAIATDTSWPYEETLLPVARRSLVRYISIYGTV